MDTRAKPGCDDQFFSQAIRLFRALAQSFARELGPQGIHLAHVVVDGMIDGVFARSNFADVKASLARDEILKPDEIQ
jgi:hypothetical protein